MPKIYLYYETVKSLSMNTKDFMYRARMFKSMIESAMLWSEENTTGRLSHGMIRNIMEALRRTATKEATKGILSAFYEAAEDNVKQPVNRGTAYHAISSRFDRITEYQESAPNNVGCVMETSTTTAFITTLGQRRVELADMYKAKLYASEANVGKGNKKAISPYPLTK